MRIALAVFCLAAGAAVKAQIEAPQVETGLVWHYDFAVQLPQGWDFTALPVVASLSQSVEPVGTSSLGMSFPGATHVVEGDGIFTFHSWTDANVYHGGIQGLTVAYSDPGIYFPYPFAVGSSWTDTFAASFNGGIAVERTGTVTAECVEMGTLVLPGGQEFPEAYRVEMTETIVDATAAGDYTIVLEGTLYFTADCPFYRAGVITSTVLDGISSPEPTPEVTQYAAWITGSTVGVEEVASAPVQVYPNPASVGGEAWVAAEGPVQVWDATGRLVLETRAHPGQVLVRLPAEHLPAGTYVVRSGNGAAARWIVQ
jgi:hypothetical protein